MRHDDPTIPHTTEAMRAWRHVGVGAVLATAGLLPWLLTGARLPLQNLWDTSTGIPENMPFALLPLSQYALPTVFGLILTGAAAAGVFARFLTRERPDRTATLLIGAGVFGVQIFAVAQSFAAAAAGLEHGTRTILYLCALAAWVAIVLFLALAAFVLIARGPRPGAAVGATLGALAGAIWLSDLVLPPLSASVSELQSALVFVVSWTPALLTGATLAWCGLRGVGSIAAWIASLALLWLVPVAFTGIMFVAGSRALLRNPSFELVDLVLRVAGESAANPGSFRTAGLALLIGVAGVLVREARGRRVSVALRTR